MIVTLASASPRRRELIAQLGYTVKIVPSKAEEISTKSTPEEIVMELAEIKARSVYGAGEKNVIGADTIVVLDGKILGKPTDEEDAYRMLKSLCGREHRVLTGLALVSDKGALCDYECTYVTFAEFDEQLIRAYVATKSPMDKAGAYGIQDKMLAPLIKSVRGELDNVIGLPTKKLKKMCAFFG